MKRKIILGALLAALLLLGASPALARASRAPLATNYCSGMNYDEARCLTLLDGFGAFISEWGITLAISVISIMTIGVWFLDRIALAIFQLVTGGTWLLNLKTDFISGIASFLPDVLRDTAFGPTGLMYLALILAGILMTVPILAQGMNRLAKPGRVMAWGVLLSTLFVSGTIGYDLIDKVETMRQEMMQTAIGTQADYGVSKLILVPMHAQESEAELAFDTIAVLPGEFVTTFFPPVEKIDVSIKTIESGTFGLIESVLESPESKAARIAGAVLALFYSLLGVFAGVIVLLSGVTFVVLGVAALFLILFLFAALPLGFFEFGETILRMIVERYAQIILSSLGISIFVRLAAGMVDQLPDLSDAPTLLEWLLLMIVFYLALLAIMKRSFGVLSASFTTFKTSIGAVWSPTGPDDSASGFWERAKQAAGGAAAGALLMGGASGALLGAAGAALRLPLMMRARGAAAAAREAADFSANRPARGDVFQNNGAAALDTETGAAAQTRQPQTDIFNPPQAAAKTIAATAGRQAPPFGAAERTEDAAHTARIIAPEA